MWVLDCFFHLGLSRANSSKCFKFQFYIVHKFHTITLNLMNFITFAYSLKLSQKWVIIKSLFRITSFSFVCSLEHWLSLLTILSLSLSLFPLEHNFRARWFYFLCHFGGPKEWAHTIVTHGIESKSRWLPFSSYLWTPQPPTIFSP